MAGEKPDVKGVRGRFKAAWACCLVWVDAHPRTGWYVAIVLTLDFMLSILDIFTG